MTSEWFDNGKNKNVQNSLIHKGNKQLEQIFIVKFLRVLEVNQKLAKIQDCLCKKNGWFLVKTCGISGVQMCPTPLSCSSAL